MKRFGWLVSIAVLAFMLHGAKAQEQSNSANGTRATDTAPGGDGSLPIAKSAKQVARLQNVKVAHSGQGISLQIEVSPPSKPTLATLTDPDRLVLDFISTVATSSLNKIEVNRNGVKSVRIGVHDTDPPMTRVVVDLSQPCQYELAVGDHSVTLKLTASETPSAGSNSTSSHAAEVPSSTATTLGLDKSAPQEDNAGTAGVSAADDSNGRSTGAPQPASQGPDPPAASKLDPPSDGSNRVGTDGTPGEKASPTDSAPSAAIGDPASAAIEKKLLADTHTSSGDLKGSATSQAGSTQPAPENMSGAKPDPSPIRLAPSSDAAGSPAPSAETTLAENSANVSPPAMPNPSATAAPPTEAGRPDPKPATSAAADASVNSTLDAGPPIRVGDRVEERKDNSSSDYVIGEQDQLTIVIWHEPDLSGPVAVRPDGMITLPLINEVKVAGLTPTQLQALLAEKLKPFINVPQVTVIVRQINSRNVYLIGQVAKEGIFPINSSTTILQLIAEAGGLNDFAKRKAIYVLRKQESKQVRYNFNYDEVIRGKKSEQNIVLQPGDTVVVP